MPQVEVRAQGAKTIEDISKMSSTVDAVNSDKVVVDISSDMPVNGTWSLDDGAEKSIHSRFTAKTKTAMHSHAATASRLIQPLPDFSSAHLITERSSAKQLPLQV